MTHKDENRLRDMKEDLIDNISQVVGMEVPGIRVFLRTLTHPDVVNEALDYLSMANSVSLCEKFEAPWNCARQAEARYENIKHGWIASHGLTMEGWCEPCRTRALNG